MDYWKECISEAFCDAAITATDEQIDTVASWVEGAHETYGMAHGHDVRQSPVETDKDREIAALMRQVAELEGDISIYRKSVASRRGVSENEVYLERWRPGEGTVMYGPR